ACGAAGPWSPPGWQSVIMEVAGAGRVVVSVRVRPGSCVAWPPATGRTRGPPEGGEPRGPAAQPADAPRELVQGLGYRECGRADLLPDLALYGRVERELDEGLGERRGERHAERRPEAEEPGAHRRDQGERDEHAEHDEVRHPGAQSRADRGANEPA